MSRSHGGLDQKGKEVPAKIYWSENLLVRRDCHLSGCGKSRKPLQKYPPELKPRI
jgi:hypothetical protein